MPRAVFDCMVFLQAAGRLASPARACFHLIEEGRVTLCLSPEILVEVRAVLTRPKTLQKFPLLSPEWVESFVRDVETRAVLLSQVPKVLTLERDPKDEPYLNLALAAQANYLVSRDRDLLDLMSRESFRKQFPELTILDPASFLRAIRCQEESDKGSKPSPDLGAETPAQGDCAQS
jgi:putative PIN family toxin of toxin-antitoxin system